MSQQNLSDPEKQLQELLKIKRLEQPSENFTEQFLEDFQHRQRSELMRRSSFELFWDRLETLLGGSARSRYTLAGAATVLFVVCGILVGNFGKAPTEMTEADKPSPTQFQAQTQPVNYEAISRSRNIQMKEVDLSVPDHGGKHIEF